MLALPVSSEISKIQLFLLKGFCIQDLIFSLVESALAKDSMFSQVSMCAGVSCACSAAEERWDFAQVQHYFCLKLQTSTSQITSGGPSDPDPWGRLAQPCEQYSWLTLQLRRVEIPSTVGAGTKTCDVFETCG